VDKEKRGELFTPRASMAAPELAITVSGTGHASLSFIAPTQPVSCNASRKIDEFPIRKRAYGPGFIGADKAPAIPGQGSSLGRGHQGGYARKNKRHRPGSSKPPAGRQSLSHVYMSLYIGVESFYGKPQDS